jgi:hypothetical protein
MSAYRYSSRYDTLAVPDSSSGGRSGPVPWVRTESLPASGSGSGVLLVRVPLVLPCASVIILCTVEAF